MENDLPFDQFWELASKKNMKGNALAYHRCCDVWSTRNSKKFRDSHIEIALWRQVMMTLDRSIDDKKQALRTKLIEQRRRTTVIINQPCQVQVRPQLRPAFPSQTHLSQNPEKEIYLPDLHHSFESTQVPSAYKRDEPGTSHLTQTFSCTGQVQTYYLRLPSVIQLSLLPSLSSSPVSPSANSLINVFQTGFSNISTTFQAMFNTMASTLADKSYYQPPPVLAEQTSSTQTTTMLCTLGQDMVVHFSKLTSPQTSFSPRSTAWPKSVPARSAQKTSDTSTPNYCLSTITERPW